MNRFSGPVSMHQPRTIVAPRKVIIELKNDLNLNSQTTVYMEYFTTIAVCTSTKV